MVLLAGWQVVIFYGLQEIHNLQMTTALALKRSASD